mgnify:CR=1 FL=1
MKRSCYYNVSFLCFDRSFFAHTSLQLPSMFPHFHFVPVFLPLSLSCVCWFFIRSMSSNLYLFFQSSDYVNQSFASLIVATTTIYGNSFSFFTLSPTGSFSCHLTDTVGNIGGVATRANCSMFVRVAAAGATPLFCKLPSTEFRGVQAESLFALRCSSL